MAKGKVTNGKRQATRNFLYFLFASLIIFLSITNLALWAKSEIAQESREPIKKEILYWESIVAQTPTYRDGYLKLATLHWQLRDDEGARVYLEKAEQVDPNSEKVKEVKAELEL